MLSRDLDRYVELQRASGLRFRTQRGLLRSFVAFAEAAGDTTVRTDRALEWAALAPSPGHRRTRLGIVRRFALAMRSEDPRYEIPAADALGPWRFERGIPYIYTSDEISGLIRAATMMGPPGSIRPLTYATLFGLLAATGLRVSEALALRIGDVTRDGLIIRESKFRKSRMVPLHPTAGRAIDAYLAARMKLGAADGALFLSDTGKAPAYPTVVAIFLNLARKIGLRDASHDKGPPCTTSGTHSLSGRWSGAAPIDGKCLGTCWHSAPT
jgi:integrase